MLSGAIIICILQPPGKIEKSCNFMQISLTLF